MTRYTMDMDEKFEQTLNDLAQGGSKADVIRKAVSTYKLLKSKVPSGSSSNVAISNNEGVVQQVVILP